MPLLFPHAADAPTRSSSFRSQIAFAPCHGVQSVAFACQASGFGAVNHKHDHLPTFGQEPCQVSRSRRRQPPSPLDMHTHVIFFFLPLSTSTVISPIPSRDLPLRSTTTPLSPLKGAHPASYLYPIEGAQHRHRDETLAPRALHQCAVASAIHIYHLPFNTNLLYPALFRPWP